MSKSYRHWSPRQSFLLPPSPMEWLAKEHLVYFVLDVIDELDLRRIEDAMQEKDARGNRPFDPKMMVGLLLYGYAVGIVSSRKLEMATYDSVPFRVLTGGLHPDHTAISEFRRVHLSALAGLFLQVLRLCREAGLVSLGHVAIDGTKLDASASRHKDTSYAKLVDAEQRLKGEVDRMLEEAERVDREEDERFGSDKRGDELPDELRTREGRLKKIRELKAKIEAEAANTRAKQLKAIEDHARSKAAGTSNEKTRRSESEYADYVASCVQIMKGKASLLEASVGKTSANVTAGLPHHSVATEESGDPKPNFEFSPTDADARIMKSNGHFLLGYNCQAAVDEKHQIVVAAAITNHPNDAGNLRPMIDLVERNCSAVPTKMTADGGYWSPAASRYCREKNIDAYISLGRERLQQTPRKSSTDHDERASMREKLKTEQGRTAYSRRAATVEPIFGQIKDARGLRAFLLRGLEKVSGEWALITTTHNLLKLFRARRASLASAT